MCVQVCVYIWQCVNVYLHAWMNPPHYHTPLLNVPPGILLRQQLWFEDVPCSSRFFICLLCHHTLICGDYDRRTPEPYLSNMSPLGVDETSVLLNVSVFSQNKFRKKAALQWHKNTIKPIALVHLQEAVQCRRTGKKERKKKKMRSNLRNWIKDKLIAVLFYSEHSTKLRCRRGAPVSV